MKRADRLLLKAKRTRANGLHVGICWIAKEAADRWKVTVNLYGKTPAECKQIYFCAKSEEEALVEVKKLEAEYGSGDREAVVFVDDILFEQGAKSDAKLTE